MKEETLNYPKRKLRTGRCKDNFHWSKQASISPLMEDDFSTEKEGSTNANVPII